MEAHIPEAAGQAVFHFINENMIKLDGSWVNNSQAQLRV